MKPPQGTGINPGHPLSFGLFSMWMMQEAGGTTLVDLVGRWPASLVSGTVPVNLTIYGAARTFATSVAAQVTVANYLRPTGSGAVTYVAFVRATTSGLAFREIIRHETTAAAQFLLLTNQNTWAFAPHGVIGEYNPAGGAPVVLGEWAMIVGTWDGATTKTYKNGVLFSSVSNSAALSTNSAQLTLGNMTGGSQPFLGDFVYAGIWNRALTAAEAQQLYVDPYCFMQPQRRLWGASALTFNPAWARGSNILIGGGSYVS